MKLQSITIAAAIVVAGVRAGAQDVRVEVFEAATGKPIVGANVSLYDSAGTIPFGGGFSDQGGRAELRAPSRGSYRGKAAKVGYAPWASGPLPRRSSAGPRRGVVGTAKTP